MGEKSRLANRATSVTKPTGSRHDSSQCRGAILFGAHQGNKKMPTVTWAAYFAAFGSTHRSPASVAAGRRHYRDRHVARTRKFDQYSWVYRGRPGDEGTGAFHDKPTSDQRHTVSS